MEHMGLRKMQNLQNFHGSLRLLVARSQKGGRIREATYRGVKAWGKVTQYKAKAKLYSIKN